MITVRLDECQRLIFSNKITLWICRLKKMSLSWEDFGIMDQDPSVSKSNPLHVDIFWFLFICLRCIIYTQLYSSDEVCSLEI